MSETLFIRLGSNAEDKVHWLIWSQEHTEIIASGELANVEALTELTEKSHTRKVTVFVPGCDVAIKSLSVPSNSARAIKQATPYMLEDDLAQEVDQLFFAYGNLPKDEQGNNCFVAVVDKAQMSHWVTWLEDAKIHFKVMLPDALALPVAENDAYSAIALGEQILIRQSQWQANVFDLPTWKLLVSQWQEHQPELAIESYSPMPAHEAKLNITMQPEELPLALLAKHASQQKFNLLQGEFLKKEKRSPAIVNWLWVAGIAVFALVLNVSIKGIALYKLSAQQEHIEQEIVARYKKAFPQSKNVRVSTVRSILNQKLKELGQNAEGEGFLSMLSQLKPAFENVPSLHPETLKYDGKRQEIRVQAIAKDYQAFDKFKTEIEKAKLEVTLGSQSNHDDGVSGSFSIKG